MASNQSPKKHDKLSITPKLLRKKTRERERRREMESSSQAKGKGTSSVIPKPKETVKQKMVKTVVSSITKAKDKSKVNPSNS